MEEFMDHKSFQDNPVFRLFWLCPTKSRLYEVACSAWNLLRSWTAFYLLDRDWIRSPTVLNRDDNTQVFHDSSVRCPLRKQPDNSAMVRLRARFYRTRARRLSGVEG